jgi:MOSC domain-containing protein YiiM
MSGVLEYIVLRPKRKQDVDIRKEAHLSAGMGIEGDHYAKSGKREVTLIQAEHLEAVAAELNMEIPLGITRRNLVVRGTSLMDMISKRLQIGEAVLEITGECHPCSRMNEVLGPGGLKAMANRGGVTAKIVQSGILKIGDRVMPL